MNRQPLFAKAFRFLSSAKFAIPILILLAILTVIGNLIPQGEEVKLSEPAPPWLRSLNRFLSLNDVFHSWWYVLLLSLLATSLLILTLRRLPQQLRAAFRSSGDLPASRLGRFRVMGSTLAHLGVLVIMAGMIWDGAFGFRSFIRLAEGEAYVHPRLPFVLKLDQFILAYYPKEAFQHWGATRPVPSQLDSLISIVERGEVVRRERIAPGRPLRYRGITLLPSERKFGLAFEVIIEDQRGRRKVVPVRPWAPPLIHLGGEEIFAHSLVPPVATEARFLLDGSPSLALGVEIVRLNGGTKERLGRIGQDGPLAYNGYRLFVGKVSKYTGMWVYSRPGKPLLFTGFLFLAGGLLLVFSSMFPLTPTLSPQGRGKGEGGVAGGIPCALLNSSLSKLAPSATS